PYPGLPIDPPGQQLRLQAGGLLQGRTGRSGRAEGRSLDERAARLTSGLHRNPMAASDFRALQATNRRQTAILVAVFILLFGLLGFGLDYLAHDFRFVNGRFVGFPILTIVALGFGSIQSLVSFYGGASLVLLSVRARPLTGDSVEHQTVLNVINEMAIASRMPVPKAYLMDD